MRHSGEWKRPRPLTAAEGCFGVNGFPQNAHGRSLGVGCFAEKGRPAGGRTPFFRHASSQKRPRPFTARHGYSGVNGRPHVSHGRGSGFGYLAGRPASLVPEARSFAAGFISL